ncbi:MAG: regulator, partial [Alphaproteobacteria bacterium]
MLGAAYPAGVVLAQDPAPSPEKMVRFDVGENVYVRSLAFDRRRGSLWVGTSVGVLEIDVAQQNVKQIFTRDQGLANEYVFAIGIAPDGAVWFGTNAGGASRYRDGKWKTFFPLHGLADYWVYAFAFPDDETVWIGTWDGASHYDPDGDK